MLQIRSIFPLTMVKEAAKSAKKNPRRRVNLRGEIMYLCSCCAMVVVLSLAGLNLNQYLSTSNVLGTSTASGEGQYRALIEEKLYWEEFLRTTPDYLDGWIELTNLNLNLNDRAAAYDSLNKAREIDPNSLKLGPFEKIFED